MLSKLPPQGSEIARNPFPLLAPGLVTRPYGEMLDGSGTDSYTQSFREVYMYRRDGQPPSTGSLASFREQNARTLDTLGPELVARVKACKNSQELRQLCAQENNPLLNQWAQRESDLKALADVPAQSADGLLRDRNFHLAPATLHAMAADKGWDQAPDGSPIADVVVVGAGPGGLATSYNLAQRGARVITLEGGYVGQAFSNAGAQSVHIHRTDRLATSLVRTGYALQDLSTVMGLPAGMGRIVAHAARARDLWEENTGQKITGLAQGQESTTAWETPAARAEEFEHFQEVGDYLAERCPNSFLIEQSPVTSIRRESMDHGSELFCLETAKGHKVYARKLVLATGLVQPGGANAKLLPQLSHLAEAHPSEYLALREDRDLAAHAGSLRDILHGDSKRQLLFSDRLLGQPDIQLAVQRLPEGSHVAVIGSGESAVKAALEVLSQNPGAHVDFFTKSRIEPAQVQVPSENFSPVVLEKAPTHPAYARASIDRYLGKFDTPVTPRSMIEALDAAQAGRLNIYELGKYFDESTVTMEPDGSGQTRLTLKDPEVADRLVRQKIEWARYGISTPSEMPSVSMVISAAGYDRKQLRADPLSQQLIDAGLMKLCTDPAQGKVGEPLFDGLVSAACPDLGFDTAAALGTAADSAIPGMAVRGRLLAERLMEDLPQRELPPQPPETEDRGAYWAGYSEKDFAGYVHYRGLAPIFGERAENAPNSREFFDNYLAFPDPERFLRGLGERGREHLTAAEKLTLDRGRELVRRIGTPDAAR